MQVESGTATLAANPVEHLAALLQRGITSSELLAKKFAPMPWLVPDIIPGGGLTILGSKMGNGKSYFLLQLGIALTTGTPFLGHETQRRGVLFICLEDSERRINSRLNQLGAIGTDKLLIYTQWAQGERALEDLRLILTERNDIRVVIIDPIVKFIDLLDYNDYGGAYGSLSPLKQALDGRKVAGLFSHHCKKSPSELDAFDDILGSTGWGAACDTRLILRRPRGSPEGTLIAGGRDVLHSESALRFEGDAGWTYQGLADEIRMSDARREILDLLTDAGPLSTSDIAKRLGKPYTTVATLMGRLEDAGKVIRESSNGRRYTNAVVNVVTVVTPRPGITTITTPTTATTPTTLTTDKRG